MKENRKSIGFSLVELMISLITISCIAAAFTPVITKKLKKQDVALSLAQTSEITNQCSGYEPKFTDKCKLCTKAYCIQCGIENCEEGQYVDTSYCGCKSCSDKFGANCIECDKNKCLKCTSGKNKYILSNDKLSCVQCPPATPWSDGISNCTAACTAPSGYFCKGDLIAPCSEKYGSECTTCDSNKCTGCHAGRRVKQDGSGCMNCDIGGCHVCTACNYQPLGCKKCNACSSDSYWYNGQCIWCKTGPLTMPHCTYCSQAFVSTPGQCGKCDDGYVLTSDFKCVTCDIANCSYCMDKQTPQKCRKCNVGYYITSSGTCATCSSKYGANCLSCDKDKCLSCPQGYKVGSNPSKNPACEATSGSFKCSDSNFMRIGNLCWTRKNMGDSPILTIPSNVIVVDSSETCYSKQSNCCWKTGNEGGCTSNVTGYSGCNRTVCAPKASVVVCESFTYMGLKWRLPTLEDAKMIEPNTTGLGANGLDLCSWSGSNRCSPGLGCKDMYYGCSSSGYMIKWGDSGGQVSYDWRLEGGNGGVEAAAAVRCVADLTGTVYE